MTTPTTPQEEWEKRYDRWEGYAITEALEFYAHTEGYENPKRWALEQIEDFATAERTRLKEEIVQLLDWRNRKDGTSFNDGDDVIDWIDAKIATLK